MQNLAADLVVLIHFLFIVFVVMGGLWVLRWRPVIYLHLPAAVWGALIEFYGWICPLTTLENELRKEHGGAYQTGFIEHYLLPIIYPQGLTREIQLLLGVCVIVINVIVYYFVFKQGLSQKKSL